VSRSAAAGRDVQAALARIREARREVAADRSVLVALSGIDGSGKGYVAARLAAALEADGLRVAVVNIDGWLNLPHLRFAPFRPAAHFYRHAIRFGPLFARLVLPLRRSRSARVEADVAEETATSYRRHVYEFDDVDVILLEGIFLLKREFRCLYDLSLWLDCSFETALERAIARGQEGLSAAATSRTYRTIYFPAQRIHLERDGPREAADVVIANDPAVANALAPASALSTFPAAAGKKCAPAPNPAEPDRIEWGAGPDEAGPPGCRATVTARIEGGEGAAP